MTPPVPSLLTVAWSDVRAAVVLTMIALLVVWGMCPRPPDPLSPTPGQHEASVLAQRNAALEAQVAATVARVRRDSIALDSLAAVALYRRQAAGVYAARADSAVARARADSATHAQRVAAYEEALTLKDSALGEAHAAILTQDQAMFIARADLVVMGRDVAALRTQNAALVASAARLSGEVTTWRARASRRWYPCGGGGAVAGAGTGGAYAGPGLFVGMCRVVVWP